MKTAITVLQEMMMKLGEVPEYECISQSGPPHQMTFEYRCMANGATATATARSKKEAKQEVARLLLLQLATRGMPVPPPYGLTLSGQYEKCASPSIGNSSLESSMESSQKMRHCHLTNPLALKRKMNEPAISVNNPKKERIVASTTNYENTLDTNERQVESNLTSNTSGANVSGAAAAGGGAGSAVDPRSYVALLKELCEEYRLPAVEYELVGDTGPAHMRQFTIRATIGQHSRLATATTKRAARQAAADMLYHYLRDNLRQTKDFVEEAALVRAHEKAMERYREVRGEEARPRLEQRPADYHLGLHEAFEPEQKAAALQALRGAEAGAEAEAALAAAAGALGLQAQWGELPRAQRPPLCVLSLSPTAPALSFAGASRRAAAAAAVKYMRAAMPAPSAHLRA